jgi:alkanesulfonate monooxygenase SsuD/methylene tetrahydromethanopterin reductase-like flavin-dependent oxidoreductase (luciferase family)
VGAGHVEAEFDLLGVEFAGRGADMDAGVTELAELLANEVVDGFGALPRPVQTPRPPIWLAGSSAPAIRRAARLGDGWLPQGPATIEALALLTAERERLGRDGEPFAVGTITPFLYVGDASWDLPADTVHGSAQQVAEQLAALVPEAVNQIQVRFRARDVNEMCDQVTAFGEGVLEALTTM